MSKIKIYNTTIHYWYGEVYCTSLFIRKFLFTDTVVKSGRKRQQETDSCINSREDTVVSFRAYWVERFLPLSLLLAVPSLSLSPSFSFLPSFSLSFQFSPSFLPSLSCNTFIEQMHSEQNPPVQLLPCVFVCSWDLVRICIRANYLLLVRDLPSSNMLEAAISVSALQTIISVGCAGGGTDPAGCGLVTGIFSFGLRGPSPQAFTPFWGGLC